MAEPDELLRMYLGEVIPEGGSEADTMFTDTEIQAFLDDTSEINAAAALGWSIKAANLSHLTDMAEGSSRRSLRQRWENALEMTKYYTALASSLGVGTPGGRTRIHQIERS